MNTCLWNMDSGLAAARRPGMTAKVSRPSRCRPSAHLHQLLQAAQAGRDLLALGANAAAPIGERDFADIDVAAAVDREPVRRDELAGGEPGMLMAQPRQQFALVGVDADPRPATGHVDIDRHLGTNLADVEARRVGAGL